MTQNEYDKILKYEDAINDAVFETTLEMLFEWFSILKNSKFTKKEIIDDALKGFRMSRIEIRKITPIILKKD